MGMFNTILADLKCPEKGAVTKDAEIQIKWQEYPYRLLENYRLGDVLEHIEDEYNNTWIKTDYPCNVCSVHSKGKDGISYVKTEDQNWHDVFIRIEEGRIVQILTKADFEKSGIKEYIEY